VSTVNIHEAKTQLSRLLERVRAGEEIIIAKAGKPCARLCPLADATPRRPGLFAGRVDPGFFDPLPRSELMAWAGDPDPKPRRRRRSRQ
jgi:prevent-host-death family protein